MGVVWAVCFELCVNNVSIIFVEKYGMGLTVYNYVKVKVLLR